MTKVYQCFAFKRRWRACISFNSKEDFFYVRNCGRCIEESLPTAISFADERIFRTTEFLLPRAIPCFTILSFAKGRRKCFRRLQKPRFQHPRGKRRSISNFYRTEKSIVDRLWSCSKWNVIQRKTFIHSFIQRRKKILDFNPLGN